MKRIFSYLCMMMVLPSAALAQSITTLDNVIFGALLRPSATGTVEIGSNGVVVFGSENVYTPSMIRAGRYQINGSDGLIDIAITGTTTCDGAVLFTRFPAQWRNQHFANILTSPIVGAQFTNGDILSLGARIQYTQFVPLNLCPASFDLSITIY